MHRTPAIAQRQLALAGQLAAQRVVTVCVFVVFKDDDALLVLDGVDKVGAVLAALVGVGFGVLLVPAGVEAWEVLALRPLAQLRRHTDLAASGGLGGGGGAGLAHAALVVDDGGAEGHDADSAPLAVGAVWLEPVVLAEACALALPAGVAVVAMSADVCPAALLASSALNTMFADALPLALLAVVANIMMLAKARASTLAALLLHSTVSTHAVAFALYTCMLAFHMRACLRTTTAETEALVDAVIALDGRCADGALAFVSPVRARAAPRALAASVLLPLMLAHPRPFAWDAVVPIASVVAFLGMRGH